MNNLEQLLPHLNFPKEVYFKKGSLIKLKFLSGDKVVIFTGKNSLNKSGVLEKIQNYLNHFLWTKKISIISEPTLENVQEIVKKLSHIEPDWIVACGGGSVIDTAKIVKILLSNPGLDLLNYIKPHTLPRVDYKSKLIAIPTTSGSGAEVSWTVPIIDNRSKRKIPFVASSFIPDSIVLDPELTLSLSVNLTGSTSLDAFTHALESYCSILSSNFTNHYAVMAGQLIHKFLLQTLENPDNLEGRENLQYAALFAGIAQNSTSVGAIHALSHTLGAMAGVPHALGNVIFLPAVLISNKRNSPKPILFIKEIGFKSLLDFFKWFEKVKSLSGLSDKWSKLSKKTTLLSIDRIAFNALEDVCMKTNVYRFNLNELINILEETK